MATKFPLTIQGTKTVTGPTVEISITLRDADATLLGQKTFTYSIEAAPLHALADIWDWARNTAFERYALSDIPGTFSLPINLPDIIGG